MAIQGGPLTPAKAITLSDLVDNGGQYQLAGKVAVPVAAFEQLDSDRGLWPIRARAYLPVSAAQIDSGEYQLLGGAATPIYEVADSYDGELPLLAYPVYVVDGSFPNNDYDEDAVVWWGEYSDQITASRRQLDSQLFVDLKAAGIFPLLDFLLVFAHEVQEMANRNAIKRAHDCALIGTPSWVKNSGYSAPVASGAFHVIEVQYNPSTQGVNYQLDDAGFGAYFNSEGAPHASSPGDLGTVDASNNLSSLDVKQSSGNLIFGVNVNIFGRTQIANSTARGDYHAQRRDSGDQRIFRNGLEIAQGLTASAAVPNDLFYVLSERPNPVANSQRQVAACWAGASLAGLENEFHDILHAYLNDIGAA